MAMRSLAALALALIAALFAFAAHAAAPQASDPALDKRVAALTQDLRCLVCQNQTIADSQAPLAIDLKNQVIEKIQQGASDKEIVDYMVDRYGDFVLYRPPLKATTLALWFGPAALFFLALFVLFRNLARRRKEAPDAPLSDAERERAEALLGKTEKEPK